MAVYNGFDGATRLTIDNIRALAVAEERAAVVAAAPLAGASTGLSYIAAAPAAPAHVVLTEPEINLCDRLLLLLQLPGVTDDGIHQALAASILGCNESTLLNELQTLLDTGRVQESQSWWRATPVMAAPRVSLKRPVEPDTVVPPLAAKVPASAAAGTIVAAAAAAAAPTAPTATGVGSHMDAGLDDPLMSTPLQKERVERNRAAAQDPRAAYLASLQAAPLAATLEMTDFPSVPISIGPHALGFLGMAVRGADAAAAAAAAVVGLGSPTPTYRRSPPRILSQADRDRMAQNRQAALVRYAAHQAEQAARK